MKINETISYKEFLAHIDEYVGKVVEFTSRMKATGKIGKFQRYVRDNHDFGELRADALIEILGVRYVRDGKLDKSVTDIIAAR